MADESQQTSHLSSTDGYFTTPNLDLAAYLFSKSFIPHVVPQPSTNHQRHIFEFPDYPKAELERLSAHYFSNAALANPLIVAQCRSRILGVIHTGGEL